MALSEIDKVLLERCLSLAPRAWEDFVDRFLGLVVHVVNHTAQARSLRLAPHDVEDLVSEVFLAIVDNDLAMLRRFRGESSLATYLTVVARRIAVRELLKRKSTASLAEASGRAAVERRQAPEERISNRDEIEQLLRSLKGPEADVIRMYHLEGRTYQEISSVVGMPENSIGPTLSRARAKMREVGRD